MIKWDGDLAMDQDRMIRFKISHEGGAFWLYEAEYVSGIEGPWDWKCIRSGSRLELQEVAKGR